MTSEQFQYRLMLLQAWFKTDSTCRTVKQQFQSVLRVLANFYLEPTHDSDFYYFAVGSARGFDVNVYFDDYHIVIGYRLTEVVIDGQHEIKKMMFVWGRNYAQENKRKSAFIA